MKKICFLVLAGLLYLTTFSQYRSIKLSELETLDGRSGFVYSLPSTAIVLKVTYTETRNLKGPYADYAATYLGLTDVIQSNNISYSLDEVQIHAIDVPDPSKMYFLEFTTKTSKETVNFQFYLSDGGYLQALNTLPNNTGKQFQGSIPSLIDKDDPESFKYLASGNFYEKIDTVKRTISIDTIDIEKLFFRSSWEEKDLSMKAKDAAGQIDKIRESRYLLISGYQEVNYGESIKYMDGELKKMEAEYLSLFMGVTKRAVYEEAFIIIPENYRTVAFRFSETTGLFEANDTRGTAIYLDILGNGIKETYSGIDAVNKTGFINGVVYAIPESCSMSIKYDNKILGSAIYKINQFGISSVLAPTEKGLFLFDENNAGLKSLGLEY